MTILLIAIALIVGLLMLRVPVAVAIGLAAMAAVAIDLGVKTPVVSAQVMVDGVNSFVLIAAPFFMLAGEIMNRGGLTGRIFRFANALVGRLPGGLGQVNIVASILFAGMSGSAISDAVGLGNMEIRAMRERGYGKRLSAGITAASSIVGPIIPPSIPMVIFGALSGTSIGALFLAGIVPGLLMGASLMITVAIYAALGHCPREAAPAKGEITASFLAALPALFLPVLVVGGIYSGFFTPTEAAVVATAYALILAFAYGEMKVRDLPSILVTIGSATGALFLIVAATALLGWAITRSGVMIEIALGLSAIVSGQTELLLIVAALCLVVGLFMEPIAALVLLVPILLPAVKILQIDPVQFGVVTVFSLMLGLLTPPVGILLFAVARIADLPVDEMTRAVIPFLVPLVVVLLLIIFFPALVLTLPRLLY